MLHCRPVPAPASGTICQMHGFGEYKYASGDVFRGGWDSGRKVSKATRAHAKVTRVGLVLKNLPALPCIVLRGTSFVKQPRPVLSPRRSSSCSIESCSGMWNVQHGYGKLSWANGDEYNGEWRHGRMHGKGRLDIIRRRGCCCVRCCRCMPANRQASSALVCCCYAPTRHCCCIATQLYLALHTQPSAAGCVRCAAASCHTQHAFVRCGPRRAIASWAHHAALRCAAMQAVL